MKKIFEKKYILKSILLIVAFLLIPEITHAQLNFVTGLGLDAINGLLSVISYFILHVTSSLVFYSGMFLSLAMNITLHVGDFYKNIPALDQVWIMIRNFSSIFIIFLLIYTSIRTILGDGTSNTKKLVANIIVAGLLINFSLFFVRILIDASNIVSLQFYRAIAPSSLAIASNPAAQGLLGLFNDGGISDILIGALKVQKIYGQKDFLKSGNVMLSLISSTTIGSIIMLTAAFSLFAAGVAIISRTAILIFIMTISPLFFAAKIFPALDNKTKEFRKLFVNQLIFLPVYLFLMYIALSFLNDESFQRIFTGNVTGNSTSLAMVNGGTPGFLVVAIQYIIALFFINLPLVAAIKFGAVGASWAPQQNTFSGWVGRQTLGRAGRRAGQFFDTRAEYFSSKYGDTKFGKITTGLLRGTRVSQATRGILSNAEKGKYGSKYSLDDIKKEEEAREKEIAGVTRKNLRNETVSYLLDPKHEKFSDYSENRRKKLEGDIGKLTGKELADIDFKKLSNPAILTKLSSSQFEKLTDDKFEDLTETQKDALKEGRKEAIKTQLGSSGGKDVIKNVSGKELAKILDDLGVKAINKETVEKMSLSQIKDMRDHIKDQKIKNEIGRVLYEMPEASHPARGYVVSKNNKSEWGLRNIRIDD